jgi:hypothetical protein
MIATISIPRTHRKRLAAFHAVLVIACGLIGCSRPENTSVSLELPRTFQALTSEGIHVKSTGGRKKEVHSYQEVTCGDGSTMTVHQLRYYGSDGRLVRSSFINVCKCIDHQVVIIVCGEPVPDVEVPADSDYEIKYDGKEIRVLTCSLKASVVSLK